jgi:hypothetical protein
VIQQPGEKRGAGRKMSGRGTQDDAFSRLFFLIFQRKDENVMEFINVVLDHGVLLILLMIGLIEAVIMIGKVSGTRNIYMVSLVIGVVLLFGYQVCYFGIPTSAQRWFDVVALGLLAGVLAPSIYHAGQKLTERAAVKIVSMLEVLIGK